MDGGWGSRVTGQQAEYSTVWAMDWRSGAACVGDKQRKERVRVVLS